MTNEILSKTAETSAELHPLIRDRWSPRIFDSTHSLSLEQVQALGEAFRWGASSYNEQPWHVVFARTGSSFFQEVSEGLVEFNQKWASHASVLVVVLANRLKDGNPRDKAATFFDAGLASGQLVIQAESMGLKAHYMAGILHDALATTVAATDRDVVTVIAIGKQGGLADQTEEIIARELTPRTRQEPSAIYTIDSKIS
jgi:nitroreductase